MTVYQKHANWFWGSMTFIGIVGTLYFGWQLHMLRDLNHQIRTGQVIKEGAEPYLQKFTAAYDQGQHGDYKHAVQTYGQALELAPPAAELPHIHFNIGNNLFLSGLVRTINEDGTFQDEARYAFTQAKISYEQALRLQPGDKAAKFNLALLHSVMARGMQAASKDQSHMELSNLPIGLP
jgi:mxaK protein